MSVIQKLQIHSGVQNVPVRACFYGPSGVGKSTFASDCPSPLFFDFEKGSHHLDVDRVEPKDWEETISILKVLRDEPHSYRSIVLDTADWAEKLLIAHVCKKHHKESIEDFGYGKGYTILAEAFAEFLALLDELRAKGIHIVFVAHSHIKKFEQPDQTGSYDRYELKLTRQTAPLLKEWCDMLLFCSYETKVVELEGKKKGIGGRERLLYTCHTAAWDAKNRQGFPEKLPFKFQAIDKAFGSINAKPASAPKAPDTKAGSSATAQQLKNIQNLWKQLAYGQSEMTKLFQWLDADSIPGAEQWKELTQEQAARAIGFLSKKITEGSK